MANTWHTRGIVHCMSNSRVSSFTLRRVCPEYFDPRDRVVRRSAATTPPNVALLRFPLAYSFRLPFHFRLSPPTPSRLLLSASYRLHLAAQLRIHSPIGSTVLVAVFPWVVPHCWCLWTPLALLLLSVGVPTHISRTTIACRVDHLSDNFEASFGQGKKVVWQILPDGDNTFFVHLVEIVVGLLLVLSIGLEYLKFYRLLWPLIPHRDRTIINSCLCLVFPFCQHHPDSFTAKLCTVLLGCKPVLIRGSPIGNSTASTTQCRNSFLGGVFL